MGPAFRPVNGIRQGYPTPWFSPGISTFGLTYFLTLRASHGSQIKRA